MSLVIHLCTTRDLRSNQPGRSPLTKDTLLGYSRSSVACRAYRPLWETDPSTLPKGRRTTTAQHHLSDSCGRVAIRVWGCPGPGKVFSSSPGLHPTPPQNRPSCDNLNCPPHHQHHPGREALGQKISDVAPDPKTPCSSNLCSAAKTLSQRKQAWTLLSHGDTL